MPDTAAEPISFARAFFRRWGIGAAKMREMRLGHRRGYIACTRLVMAQDLELKTGRREPHWFPPSAGASG